MAGFGSGRSGGSSGGGFGSGRRSSSGSSFSNKGYSSGNTFVSINSSDSCNQTNSPKGWISIMFTALIFIFLGILFLYMCNSSYEKVDAVITFVEQKEDSQGVYYDYKIEYTYDGKIIKNQWQDDFFQDVGYEFKLYVDKDNPANFQFEKPYDKAIAGIGIAFIGVGTLTLIKAIMNLVMTITAKKKLIPYLEVSDDQSSDSRFDDHDRLF